MTRMPCVPCVLENAPPTRPDQLRSVELCTDRPFRFETWLGSARDPEWLPVGVAHTIAEHLSGGRCVAR